jgi:hypothetical protein
MTVGCRCDRSRHTVLDALGLIAHDAQHQIKRHLLAAGRRQPPGPVQC